MPLDNLRTTLEGARAVLIARCASEKSSVFYQTALQGFDELLGNIDFYVTMVNITRNKFYANFMQNITRLAALQGKEDDTVCQDLAFYLIEELAVFIRECHLRFPNRATSPQAYAVMTFFENSGNWHAEDELLVTKHYYGFKQAVSA